jgi:uncharacterized protein (TIGR03643 family)
MREYLDLNRLIEMAWQDRTTFDVIEKNITLQKIK